MKKIRAFLLTLFLVAPALAQERVFPPASQSEVNAGTIHTKFVAPDTLAARIGAVGTNSGTFLGSNAALSGTASPFAIGGNSSQIGFYNAGSSAGQEEEVFNASGWNNYWNVGNGFPFVTFYRGFSGDYTWRTYNIISTIPGAPSLGNKGAEQTTFAPFVGGSASSMYDLPLPGPDIMHTGMPRPWLGVTTDFAGVTEADPSLYWTNILYLTNMSIYFRTSGIASVCNTFGSAPVVYIDDGWEATNRNADGTIAALTGGSIGALTAPNLFPGGVSNVCYIMHTNGSKLVLGVYQTTKMPNQFPGSPGTVADTAYRADISGFSENSYPSAANTATVPYTFPVMTADSVPLDIWTFYTNGVDGIFVQDMNFAEFQAFEHAKLTSIADAIVYPGTKNFGRAYWRNVVYKVDPTQSGAIAVGTYTNNPDIPHQLWFGYFGNHLGPETSYYANFLSPDQNPPTVGGSGALGITMGYVQNYNYQSLSNWVPGTFPGFFLAGQDDKTFTMADYTNFYSIVGEFNGVALTGWYTNSWNTNQTPIATNANFQSTWQDTTGGFPKQILNDYTNTLWLRQLADGFTVLAVNQGVTSSNFLFNLVPFGLKTNVIYNATNILSQTAFGTGLLTNNFTNAMSAGSLWWVKLTPMRVAITNGGSVYWASPVQSP